jgi:hypothetical protein
MASWSAQGGRGSSAQMQLLLENHGVDGESINAAKKLKHHGGTPILFLGPFGTDSSCNNVPLEIKVNKKH